MSSHLPEGLFLTQAQTGPRIDRENALGQEAPQEDPVCIGEGHLRSGGPNGP